MIINYFTIPEFLSPHEADAAVHAAKLSGADSLFVFHERDTDPFCAAYHEKLLALFRAAMRHKIKIFLSDDSFPYSGTAFGALSSVPDLHSKALFMTERSSLSEEEVPLWEDGEKCVVVRTMPPSDKYPNLYYPCLSDPLAFELVRESVYVRFIREYKKFVGYEFKGFVSLRPSFSPPMDECVPYFDKALDAFCEKYGALPNLPALFSDSGEKERYLSACAEMLERNYLGPIKALCGENSLAFHVLTEKDFTFVRSLKDLSHSMFKKTQPLLSFSVFDEMAKTISSIRNFVLDISDILPRIALTSDVQAPQGGCVFVNDSDEERTFVITLPEGEYFAHDAEKNAVYEFKSGSYTFSPHAFLCVSDEGSPFPDPLPIRIGGVRTCEFSGAKSLSFRSDSDNISFALPDEDLLDKALVFEGDITSLRVKIGNVSHFLVSPPFLLPLFDFYRGFSVAAMPNGGSIGKVTISSLK